LISSLTSSVASSSEGPEVLVTPLRQSDDNRVRCYSSQFADV